MLYTRLVKQLKLQRIRQLHSTFVRNENKSVHETSTTTQTKPNVERVTENILGSPLHNVTPIDRRILVWVKRYPSLDQVPRQVSIECIQRAHTMVRVRLSIMLMATFTIVFFLVAIMGKRDVASGINILTERQKWHEQVREKARLEAESKGKE